LTQDFMEYVKAKCPTVLLKFVPASCTGVAQPMDVGAQKPLKDATRAAFNAYIQEVTRSQLAAGKAPADVKLDTRLSVIKPLLPYFLEAGFKRLEADPALVRKAWQDAGLVRCWDAAFQRSAVQLFAEGKLFPDGNTEAAPSMEPFSDPSPREQDEDDDEALATLAAAVAAAAQAPAAQGAGGNDELRSNSAAAAAGAAAFARAHQSADTTAFAVALGLQAAARVPTLEPSGRGRGRGRGAGRGAGGGRGRTSGRGTGRKRTRGSSEDEIETGSEDNSSDGTSSDGSQPEDSDDDAAIGQLAARSRQ
jgi:hypothetical protein